MKNSGFSSSAPSKGKRKVDHSDGNWFSKKHNTNTNENSAKSQTPDLNELVKKHEEEIHTLKSVIVHQQVFLDEVLDQMNTLKSLVGNLVSEDSKESKILSNLSDLELDTDEDLALEDRPLAPITHQKYISCQGITYKNIDLLKHAEESSQKIISWKYDKERKFYVVKRKRGIMQYFEFTHKLMSLSVWEFDELGKVPFINYDNDKDAKLFHEMVVKKIEEGFTDFDAISPQRPKCKRSKLYIDPVTGSEKLVMSLKPADVMKEIPLPKKIPESLQKFIKWHYNSNTGEAIIQCEDNVSFRLYDPMDVMMFGKEDLLKLKENEMKFSNCADMVAEARLFSHAVSKALVKIKKQISAKKSGHV